MLTDKSGKLLCDLTISKRVMIEVVFIQRRIPASRKRTESIEYLKMIVSIEKIKIFFQTRLSLFSIDPVN
jgi:hypothetical protein